MIYLIIFLIALLIGSFLNVCIYRIPLGQSVSYPPSHCTSCGRDLKPVDLVPVLSYLFCGGRCRYCGEKISLQYPVVELLNTILWTLLFIKYHWSVIFVKYAVLASLLIVISFIDYQHQIIPDSLIKFGLITGAIINLLYNIKENYIQGIIGFLVGGGIFFIIAVVTNGAMGGGDIKLMAVLGFCLGWKQILLITFLAFVTGAIVSVVLIALQIKGRKDYIPFGPFISISAFIAMYCGSEIINWYFGNIFV